MPRAIPTEVVEILLNHCFNASDREHKIGNLLCVSSTWRDPGLRILYTDIVLNPNTISSFVKSSASSTNLALAKSLTIVSRRPSDDCTDEDAVDSDERRLSHRQGNCRARELNANLGMLASIVPQMSQLATFSFYIKSQNSNCQVRTDKISRASLRALVDALSPKLRHLEIDTKCYDRVIGEDEANHLCVAIAQRLPDLESLRLHLAVMCSKIISASDTLESCVICLQWQDQSSFTVSCEEQARLNAYNDRGRPEIAGELQMNLKSTICTTLLPSPALRQLIMTTFQQNLNSGVQQANVRDLLKEKTTCCPVQNLGSSKGDEAVLLLRHTTPQGATSDAVGLIGDIEELLESPSWHSTSQGPRFPHSYRYDSLQGKKHTWAAYNNFGTHETYPRRLNEAEGGESLHIVQPHFLVRSGTSLWDDEANAGRHLVEIKVIDGTDKVEELQRLDDKIKIQVVNNGAMDSEITVRQSVD